jgi:hypothetical protein
MDTTTIFNEVMYHPANAADAEWIELRNVMSINMDLSGWTISGGINYTFPEGTVISAGGFLVIASNPTALQASAGITGVLGPWVGALNNGGETIRLNDRASRAMDELTYNDKGGWPAGADGSGMSLTRRDGHLSGTEPEHWVASSLRGGTPGTENFALQLGQPVEVFGFASPWLYLDASPGLATGWATNSYTAGTDGWLSGNGVLAFENAPLPAPVGTVLASPASHPARTYYFQKQFTFSGDPSAVQLTLRTLLDDGAVIYLNGHRVARVRMPSGIPASNTPASSEVTDAAFSDLILPTTALVNGTNRLSVEVHEAGSTLGKASDAGGLTLSGLQLEEVGGIGFATNHARQAGAVAFAKDLIGNGAHAPTHTIPNLNNGSYGNGSSWIGNSANSFCGISFGATPVSLARVAWGRDNTGTYSDRTAGTYTLEYTAVPNPGVSTTATGNPATGWALIGTAIYPANSLPYSARHAFSFAPVMATGIRLTTPGNGIGNGTCIDELEAGPEAPVVPVFELVGTGGVLDSGKNLALTGTAFAKDVIPNFPAHTIPHLNDGLVGNNFSWIGGSANTFCGIGFSSAREIGRIAFGRDNTGTYSDRTFGIYLVQYTTTANPNGTTSDGAWTTIGTILVDGSIPSPSLRHVYEFAPVNATGIRLRTPDGACIDELEIYAPEQPDVVWGAALTTREIAPDPTASPLRISEIAGTNAATWKIELQNTGSSPLEIGGIAVVFSGAPNAGYTLPTQTLAPGAFLSLDQGTLGFRPQADDRIFLLSADRAGLMDAVFVKTTTRARDVRGRMLVPTADSFGSTNPFSLSADIVINEIMYHFPPNPSGGGAGVTDNPEEWIELHNKGTTAVDLGGWSLEGVNFVFPTGTALPAGGYLVVARNAGALAQKWPEQAARIVGNFTGSLSNSGERVALIDAAGNPADEIRYATSGSWPASPDGGGASLELRDPRTDRNNGHAWSASDEANDLDWQTVSYTMVAGQTFGQTPLWNEFRIGMLDAGECLIDDVSVTRLSNGQQLIQGGDFSSLNNKWRLLGNHGASAIGPEPGNPANQVLHVRSSGPFSWNHNHIETTFLGNTPIVDGQAYTVSFRARWLSGTNQLNTRAYYSRLAQTTELALPTQIGTPGAINSRFAANAGPTLRNLSHSPAIPQATEPVTVRVHVSDPDGINTVTLRYALNGSSTYSDVPMTVSGEIYSGEIPAQSAGTIVQFHVAAADSPGAPSVLPIGGTSSRALYLVDDEQSANVPAHELRVIMLPADNANLLAPLNRLSDARVSGTAIYRRSEVFYDIGVRLQGTAAGRIRDGEAYPGYDIAFPGDHPFRGLHNNVNIDRSGRGPVVRGQDEIYVKHLFHRAGVPCTYDDLVYLIVPNSAHTGTAILQMAGYGSEFVESQFGDGGTVFNMDGTYEPSTTTDGNAESLKNPVPLASQISSDFTDLGADKEQYRGQLDPRSGRRRDDFAGLIAFCKAMAAPNAQLGVQVGTKMDVDEWMHCAAIYSLWGIADCYMTAGFPHNLRLHVPSDGKNITALPWDMDFVMFSAPTSPAILAGGNLLRVINNVPGARHAYFGHLHQLCSTTFTAAYYNTWLQHYGSVVGQTMTGAATYIEARRTSVLSQLPASATFAITTNGGADFSVNASTTLLTGTGWINVREIRRTDTDAPLNITWLTDTTWQASVALKFGENPITLIAYDFGGLPIANDSVQISSTLPTPSPRDFLRITEVHYHPAEPLTALELAASTDADDFEFVELQNMGTETLNIGDCQFTAGFDYQFPIDTLLAAGESIVVVRNVTAFQARYGNTIRVAGPYGPADRLSDDGETITLRDASGAIIQSFAYRNTNLWPVNADQAGHSLVAIAPQLPLDRTLATHWRSSVSVGGNPGGSDAAVFSGSPTDDADKDGLNAFLEHALGTSDTIPDSSILNLTLEPGGTVLISFSARLNADDVDLKIEMGGTLTNFGPANGTRVQSTQTGATLIQTWRLTPPLPAGKFFTRLRAASR